MIVNVISLLLVGVLQRCRRNKKIFSAIKSNVWQPQVLDKTDVYGNRLVELRGYVFLSCL